MTSFPHTHIRVVVTPGKGAATPTALPCAVALTAATATAVLLRGDGPCRARQALAVITAATTPTYCQEAA